MACRLFGAKPLSEPVLIIVNWTLRNILQGNFNQNTKLFIHQNASENIVCEKEAFSPGGDELTRGGWPRKKYSPHPWPRSQTRSYRAYQDTQTPLFSNPLMLPFDTQVCHKWQICLRFHQIIKVILEMAFSAHCTLNWKLNRIFRTGISKVAQKCTWCCERCMTAPHWARRWCKLVQWCMKAWLR